MRLEDIKDPRLLRRINDALGGSVGTESTPVIGQRARPSDDPESELHDYILEYSKSRGWLAIHSRMDRPTTTACGVSDFILVTPENVYFVEAKRKGKKPTPKQQAFLTAVRVLGWPQAVVRSREEFLEFIQGRQ